MPVYRLSILQTALVGILAAGLLAAGIYFSRPLQAAETSQAGPPAPKVEVIELAPTEVRTWHNYSGRLQPVASASIRPLVGGTIEQVLFEDGQLVSKGDPLFVIDPRPHQAELLRAEANLANTQARARNAADELARAKQLFESKLISASIYDTAATDSQVAQAEVRAAQSALSRAQLNVEYAHITAPISGRIGRAEITVGNVVEAGINAPILTTIVASDRLYAEFNVNEQAYLALTRTPQDVNAMPVKLKLSMHNSPEYIGHIHSFDNHLNPDSGTIRARAIFTNDDGYLTPGMFADVSLGSAVTDAALLVPERAIGTNQDKKFVFVIDADNKAQYREVALGGHIGRARIIDAGLEAGDLVAINSLAHLRPNTTVEPIHVNLDTTVASQ